MIRVLHVFSVGEIGGAEAVILNLIRFKEDPGIAHVAALLTDEHGPLEEALAGLNVPVRRVARGRMRNPLGLWRAVRGLRRHIRDAAPSVIVANSAQAFVYARIAALGLRIPVTIYYMAVPETRLLKNGALDILMVLGAPEVVFTASRAIGATVRSWGLSNVIPVYHGTPARSATSEEIQAVERILGGIGVPANAPVILLAGRLQRWKGQRVLVKAFPQVLRSHPDAHAVLLGGTLFGMDKEYPDELREEIAHLGMAGHIHLVGHHPSIRGWIERAAIVVHASVTADAFPNVCIEALAARRPLITNTLAGTREIVAEREGAIVIGPGDPDVLAAAIVKLLDDPEAANAMASRGRECYESAATPLHMVRPIESSLAHLVGARVTGGRIA